MEPKNALVRQFKRIFSLNNVWVDMLNLFCLLFANAAYYFVYFQVKLHFTDGALSAIAKKAMSKNTGARGLRTILESILIEAMYEVLFCHSLHRTWSSKLCQNAVTLSAYKHTYVINFTKCLLLPDSKCKIWRRANRCSCGG